MKRIVGLLLCISMIVVMLVSCKDDEIGAYRPNYDGLIPEDKTNEVLDFYIIVGEGTSQNAITTVSMYINQYLEGKFKTTLDIHYLTEAQYEARVMADVKLTNEDRADIILITSADMYDALYASNSLAPISYYLDPNNNFEEFDIPELKSTITTSLYEASKDKNSVHYAVPNNYVIGEYEYFLVNYDVAKAYGCGNTATLAGALSMDNEYIVELKARMAADGKTESQINDAIKIVSGMYEDKAMYEAAGFVCNVITYPTATKEAAFESAFAVVRHTSDLRNEPGFDAEKESSESKAAYTSHYERCMEIIWALNTDEYFRNLLQYGVEHTNYSTYEKDGVEYVSRFTDSVNNFYNIDLKYTGDIFAAYYCEELGWTHTASANGEMQNKESVFVGQ